MTLRTQTFVRAFIAAVVIGLTFVLTYQNASISESWASIFLLVIGYYFSDRPSTTQAQLTGAADDLSDARVELLAHVSLAAALIIGTAALFVFPQARTEIEGAWIAGVALAVGFYFKDSGGVVAVQVKSQAVLAVLMLVLTTAIYARTALLPVQWLSLVFLVVAFYFKDRATDSAATAPTPTTLPPTTPTST